MANLSEEQFYDFDFSDNQVVFNHVIHHLMEQKTPALENGSCVYRNSENQSCAVGCLIPDELYAKADIEALAPRDLSHIHPHYNLLRPALPLLDRLQHFHDFIFWTYQTKIQYDRLRAIADDYHLTLPVTLDEWRAM